MVKISYYYHDKDGYVIGGQYESIDRDMVLYEHINAARKQAGVSRDNFFIISSSCAPTKTPDWVNPNWPVIPFPKKRSKLAFGRYVYEPEPVKDENPGEPI